MAKGTKQQTLRPFKLINQALRIAGLGAIILSIVFAMTHFRLSRYFPIKSVQVYGVNHVDRAEVQALLVPLVSHGFFTINVESIRDRLLQLPWVSHIAVRRHWPDKVEITIFEKTPIALWNGGVLLSDAGELFTPDKQTYPRRLPTFVGPETKHIDMLKYFNKMNRMLLPLRAKISNLELTPYFTWKLTLDNGITLQIGHKDILTRLDHFVKVYPKIVGDRATDVEYIDLRYPNGVAVRWKGIEQT